MEKENKEVYLLHKKAKMIFVILGLILIIQGIFRLLGAGVSSINLLLGISLTVLGSASLIYSLLNHSIPSKKAGRVELDDNGFLIKQDLFRKPISENWENIQAMDLGDYTLGFKKNNEMHYIKYNTKKDSSEEIKNAFRGYANKKNIQVLND